MKKNKRRRRNPKIPKGKYLHYQGKLYEVLGEGRHSETLEELVIYKALYKTKFGRNSIWLRPKKMFLETVWVEGQNLPRFKKISNRTHSQ